jgi:hypothetical protein
LVPPQTSERLGGSTVAGSQLGLLFDRIDIEAMIKTEHDVDRYCISKYGHNQDQIMHRTDSAAKALVAGQNGKFLLLSSQHTTTGPVHSVIKFTAMRAMYITL